MLALRRCLLWHRSPHLSDGAAGPGPSPVSWRDLNRAAWAEHRASQLLLPQHVPAPARCDGHGAWRLELSWHSEAPGQGLVTDNGSCAAGWDGMGWLGRPQAALVLSCVGRAGLGQGSAGFHSLCPRLCPCCSTLCPVFCLLPPLSSDGEAACREPGAAPGPRFREVVRGGHGWHGGLLPCLSSLLPSSSSC